MVEKKALSKVVLLGNLHSGKTTLLNSYCGTANQNRSTISQDCRKIEIKVNTTAVTLQLWDTAGQEQFNSIGFAFYRGANCCVLVYDIANRESFEKLGSWRQNFIEHANPEDPSTFPFIVVGNKNDLERVVSE
jgi:Ras-related protein Rab-7A